MLGLRARVSRWGVLLCSLGIHSWRYVWTTRRVCNRCPRFQDRTSAGWRNQ